MDKHPHHVLVVEHDGARGEVAALSPHDRAVSVRIKVGSPKSEVIAQLRKAVEWIEADYTSLSASTFTEIEADRRDNPHAHETA